ncbi:type II toxin-antitoxin system VapC family toxin [Pelotomaculum terephthalicicum JT]|uniref:type II toxin-antitoxin system VapC family toxin n=1 Tax=Pelotomaculum terephthalicicum TaxID=206393 RepID=UPI0009D4FF60|nr:type II toxin-antitoxin system VapC family toxin [Pelotomaculum terephthalicicum]MCG9966584.1 type II toxin-antitoxin system VapC family toxin [Pelotomaculum terephthalicicum JT]OPY63523.1 MAG: Ribonuclease VapC19 [Pelotomaculum sp. PtaU1.Bin065]
MESNGFLLDTTILIDLFRGRQEAIVFLDKLSQEGSLFVCPIVVSEIFSGVRPQEMSKVEVFFEAMNYCAIDYRTAKRAGLYKRDFQKKGITLSISDALIAATAVDYSLTLVTKNVRHFPMKDLSIIEHS